MEGGSKRILKFTIIYNILGLEKRPLHITPPPLDMCTVGDYYNVVVIIIIINNIAEGVRVYRTARVCVCVPTLHNIILYYIIRIGVAGGLVYIRIVYFIYRERVIYIIS